MCVDTVIDLARFAHATDIDVAAAVEGGASAVFAADDDDDDDAVMEHLCEYLSFIDTNDPLLACVWSVVDVVIRRARGS